MKGVPSRDHHTRGVGFESQRQTEGECKRLGSPRQMEFREPEADGGMQGSRDTCVRTRAAFKNEIGNFPQKNPMAPMLKETQKGMREKNTNIHSCDWCARSHFQVPNP